MTRLTVAECPQLVPLVEVALQAPMARWCRAGQPRTARRDTTDQHGALRTPADRLVLIWALQTSPLRVVQGRLFGMGQSKAPQGMHVLVVVVRATRRPSASRGGRRR